MLRLQIIFRKRRRISSRFSNGWAIGTRINVYPMFHPVNFTVFNFCFSILQTTSVYKEVVAITVRHLVFYFNSRKKNRWMIHTFNDVFHPIFLPVPSGVRSTLSVLLNSLFTWTLIFIHFACAVFKLMVVLRSLWLDAFLTGDMTLCSSANGPAAYIRWRYSDWSRALDFNACS